MLSKVNTGTYNVVGDLLTTVNLNSSSNYWNYNGSGISITDVLAIETGKQYMLKFNFNGDVPETKKYLTVYCFTSSGYVPALFNEKEVVQGTNIIPFKFTGANYGNINSGIYPAYLTEKGTYPAYNYKNDYLYGTNVTSFEIYEGKVSITAKKIYTLEIAHIREFKSIGKNVTYTLLGKHTDNTRILDTNTISFNLEYIKTKGTYHNTSISDTVTAGKEYTAIGYGYCSFEIVYDSSKSPANAYATINGVQLFRASSSGASCSSAFFFKPGDYFYFRNVKNLTIVDYY